MAKSNNAILGTRFQIFNQLRGVHPNAETDFTVCIIPQSQENQISLKKNSIVCIPPQSKTLRCAITPESQ